MAFESTFVISDKKIFLNLHKAATKQSNAFIQTTLRKYIPDGIDDLVLNSGCEYKENKIVEDSKKAFTNPKHTYQIGLVLNMRKDPSTGWKNTTTEKDENKIDRAIATDSSNKTILNGIKQKVVYSLKKYMTTYASSNNAKSISYEALDISFYTSLDAACTVKDFQIGNKEGMKTDVHNTYDFALFKFAYTIGLKKK